ncbi:inositol-1-monophosphatase, putative [Pseudooceanicola batsensis HTCC2597]|uniref:Inositol-1-monophosphatase, putative n=1 Tax=Pseudooceanicola batsensis (strain ATCC BAA-863 / DSM 15984 / KCTC 12145 / HTCC2597) TaxID=252305 RepID=A3U1X3_PSEBH|nr:inositol-1-monophosphatase, putative [Pseudooceanicola batsensis HTCC2597]
MTLSANLNVMKRAARKAGRSLVKDFSEVENLQVSMKGAGAFVGRTDIAPEEIIKAELTEARPNHGWRMRDTRTTRFHGCHESLLLGGRIAAPLPPMRGVGPNEARGGGLCNIRLQQSHHAAKDRFETEATKSAQRSKSSFDECAALGRGELLNFFRPTTGFVCRYLCMCNEMPIIPEKNQELKET